MAALERKKYPVILMDIPAHMGREDVLQAVKSVLFKDSRIQFDRDTDRPIDSVALGKNIHTKKPMNHAFVNFTDPIFVTWALDTQKSMQIGGNTCHFLHKGPRTSLFQLQFTNLPQDTTADDFKAYLAKHFPDFETYFVKVFASNEACSTPHGFASFDSKQKAQMVYEKMKADSRIEVFMSSQQIKKEGEIPPEFQARAKFSADSLADRNVFISPMPSMFDKEWLEETFSQFGEIVSARLFTHTANSGHAFVCFKDVESAARAIEKMDGAAWGHEIIHVSLAKKKTSSAENSISPTNSSSVSHMNDEIETTEIPISAPSYTDDESDLDYHQLSSYPHLAEEEPSINQQQQRPSVAKTASIKANSTYACVVEGEHRNKERRDWQAERDALQEEMSQHRVLLERHLLFFVKNMTDSHAFEICSLLARSLETYEILDYMENPFKLRDQIHALITEHHQTSTLPSPPSDDASCH